MNFLFLVEINLIVKAKIDVGTQNIFDLLFGIEALTGHWKWIFSIYVLYILNITAYVF